MMGMALRMCDYSLVCLTAWCLQSGMADLPASSEDEGSSSCALSTNSSNAPNVQSLISVLKALKHSDLSHSDYLAKAADVSPEMDTLEWWRRHEGSLPYWTGAFRKVLLVKPSSAAAERVFSLLKATFSDQQDSALQDYLESSIMLQYNKE